MPSTPSSGGEAEKGGRHERGDDDRSRSQDADGRLQPERAFEVFTSEVASWWPTKTHSIHKEKVTDVVLEPREGGEMYEIAEGGEREHWARVTAWEPPRRLVLAWHVNPETAAPTEIEVTFTPDGEGTRVELEHRDWEQAGAGAARCATTTRAAGTSCWRRSSRRRR